MAPTPSPELDSLALLEARITRAVEVVSELRAERDSLKRELNTLKAERDSVLVESASAGEEVQKKLQELEELRAERKQVRERIEKLLAQMDLLGS
jgi:chromosome segregation ATPase